LLLSGQHTIVCAVSQQTNSATLGTTLKQIWMDLLNIGEVGDDDHFFSLGGDSMGAMRMLARIESDLQVRLTMSAVMEHLVLRDLVGHIVRLLTAGPSAAQPSAAGPDQEEGVID
jgi:iturin family lipopeptide synthetase A